MVAQIVEQIRVLNGQLREVLKELTDEEYNKKIGLLSNASLGQHTRHIIDFFVELFIGYESGTINYDQRKRDLCAETDRIYARDILQGISLSLDCADKPLILQVDFGSGAASPSGIPTNFYRELVYNLEHTVHHMAFLRIGVNAVSAVPLPADFGVAASTIRYRNTCAQ